MSSSDAEWLREVETYLDLGADGVVVLVDNADDARLGELGRHLLRKHPELMVVVSAAELYELPERSHVLLYLQEDDLTALNLARQVLRDRALRVALWSPRALTKRLAARAPDLYDWISHRVECPPGGVPRFVRLGLLAAEKAEQCVAWVFDDIDTLRRGVAQAWPGVGFHHLRVRDAGAYDSLVERIQGFERADFVGLDGQEGADTTARWALAEAGRRARVALRGQLRSLFLGWSLWEITTYRSLARSQQRQRQFALIVDGEMDVAAPWDWSLDGCLDAEDPAAVLGVLPAQKWGLPALRSQGAQAVQAATIELRARLTRDPSDVMAWQTLAGIERERLLDDPPAEPIPKEVWVECQLWRADGQPWAEMAEIAAEMGLHDIAMRWEGFADGGSAAFARRVQISLVGRPLGAQLEVLERAKGEDADPQPWWRTLDALVQHEAGRVIATAPPPADSVAEALGMVLRGDWRSARGAIAARSGRIVGPLERSALAFCAWCCDQAELVRAHSRIVDLDSDSNRRSRELWWWSALGLTSQADHGLDESNLLRNWGVELDPWTLLAGAVGTARQGRNRLAMRLSAKAIGVLGQADGVHEHYLEGVLSLVRARALARLGQPGRAQDHFRIATSIVRRTTENEDHPWALMADFEYAWLRAQHDGAPREGAQNALHALQAALWPEHAEVRAAASLLART